MSRNNCEALTLHVLQTGEVVPANDVVWTQHNINDKFSGQCISTLLKKHDAEGRLPPPICDALFACTFSETVPRKDDPTKKDIMVINASCGAAGPDCLIGAAHATESFANTWPPEFNKYNENACRLTRIHELDYRKQTSFFHATNRALPLLCIDHHRYTRADGSLMMPGDACCYAASGLPSSNNFIIPSVRPPCAGDACRLFGVGNVRSGPPDRLSDEKIAAFCLKSGIRVQDHAVRIRELHDHHSRIFSQKARIMTEGVFLDPATRIDVFSLDGNGQLVNAAFDNPKTFLDFENALYDCPSSDTMSGGFVSQDKYISVGDVNYFVVQAIHGSSATPLSSNHGLMTCSISFAILYCGFPLLSNMQMFIGMTFENMSQFNPYGEYVSEYFAMFRDEMLGRRDEITQWYLSEDAQINFPEPSLPPLPEQRREIFGNMAAHLDGFFGWLASLSSGSSYFPEKGVPTAVREKYS